MSNQIIIEINDEVLEVISGGHGRRGATVNAQKTNNSTIILYNFSVKGSGGLGITVVQSIS